MNRKRKPEVSSRFWNLQNVATFVSLILGLIGIAGAINSVYGIYTAKLNRKHQLTIDIVSMKATGNRVSYVIAFINDGDYPEIVAGAESFLGQLYVGYQNPALHEERSCFEPFVIGAKGNKVITYTTEYDLDAKELRDIPGVQKWEFIPMIMFEVRAPHDGFISTYARLGYLTPPSFRFRTQTLSVNFDDIHPQLVLAPFPVDTKDSAPSLCGEL